MIFVNGKENNNKIIQIGDKIVKLIDTLNENKEIINLQPNFDPEKELNVKTNKTSKKEKCTSNI